MKIIHLHQSHRLSSEKPTAEYVEHLVANQIDIAKFIQKHPNIPVFLEALTEDSSNYDGPFTEVAEMIFPDGFPKSPTGLNSVQKQFIYEYGSVRILHFLGVLNELYKTLEPAESEEITKKIAEDQSISAEGVSEYMFRPREEAAIKSIKLYAQHFEGDEVFLVFGRAHDFSHICKENGFTHEKKSFNEAANENRLFFK